MRDYMMLNFKSDRNRERLDVKGETYLVEDKSVWLMAYSWS